MATLSFSLYAYDLPEGLSVTEMLEFPPEEEQSLSDVWGIPQNAAIYISIPEETGEQMRNPKVFQWIDEELRCRGLHDVEDDIITGLMDKLYADEYETFEDIDGPEAKLLVGQSLGRDIIIHVPISWITMVPEITWTKLCVGENPESREEVDVDYNFVPPPGAKVAAFRRMMEHG